MTMGWNRIKLSNWNLLFHANFPGKERQGLRKGKASYRTARLCVDSSIPRGEGQGGQARAERGQKEGVFNSRISQI